MRVEQRLFAILAVALTIPACGGGGGSGGGPASPTGTASDAAAPGGPATADPAVTGLGSGQPPFIRIVSPASGSTCQEGATVTIQVVAVDADAVLVRVDFFDGGRLIGSRAAPPFMMPLGGLTPGVHHLTAVAFDVQGQSASSDPVTVFVVARSDPNRGPRHEHEERD